ncbi:MAG TPA: PQQ-binding-like beta-propeller repeat protein, partial [Gemmatimonadales bacterium]|nr:PQQ-binding-like beta-propeller repeat protein [Gemmatimonadales bacterium]
TGGRVRSTPAVVGGRVYVGSADGYVYCFDLASGSTVWRHATLGTTLESGDFGFDRRTVQSSPAVSGGLVFVGARDGFLYALSADSGALRWSFDHKVSWVNASPAVAGGTVYVGSSDGRFVQAVDAATGSEIWRTAADAIVWSSAAVVGDQLLVGDGRGRVRSYDRATGEVRWSFTTGAQVYSSPVPAGSLVIFGSADGGVYALRTGATPVRRAVFADTIGPVKPAPDELEHALALAARGYTLLDAAGLEEFLQARIADRAPSVVVFPTDLPPAMQTDQPAGSPLRRYLDAGGKVVWATRFPPLMPPIDPATGQMTGGLGAFHWDAPGQLLGMALAGSIFDQRTVRPTAAGERWGLWLRWRDGWGIEPVEATEVLALDDWGLAASWVKSFGGAPGTGYVRAPTDDVQRIYDLAEYRPAPRP